ncbi:MAG: hypothetical protein RJA34_1031 [Pseudomonadota bacterium]|jgi:prephenate dehydrogenase
MMFEQLGLIGCGLMGGSFAMALKNAGLVKRVVGYSRSTASSTQALSLGVIDEQAETAEHAAAGSDLVLLAVPVASTESTLRAIQPQVTSDMLIMDVGSTKQDVIQAARRALGASFGAFVPVHPIAGKEVSGVDNADPLLYKGRPVILTPEAETGAAQVQQAKALWTALGCKVARMSAADHDAAFAAVSHLPHLLAFAYMNALVQQSQGDRYLSLAGTGFRDFSRIAASEPSMWRDILIANRDDVLQQSRLFRQALEALEICISAGDGDALKNLISDASRTRAQWTLS